MSGRRIALIGHRGVGKTSLLQRILSYYRETGRACRAFDLDTEIARRSGRSIIDIFKTLGEAEFRRLERLIFAELESEAAADDDCFVVLGAGYDVRALSGQWQTLWIRRRSDRDGRIFINDERPRLNAEVTPLAEFSERFAIREEAFRERADAVLILDEGLESDDECEREFFLSGASTVSGFSNLGGALTLLPEVFRSSESFASWCRERISWGIARFELRDDLLSDEQVRFALTALPQERILFSFRSPVRRAEGVRLVNEFNLEFDWPLEMGRPVADLRTKPWVVSLHERTEGQSLSDALARLTTVAHAGCLLKAALPVSDFHELAEGHAWQQADPANRVFLPLSGSGRWSWYRLLMGVRLNLNFWRESDGSGADQPTLLQWARRRKIEGQSPKFAAVLGAPVAHSRTPIEQADFFRRWGMSVFAIDMSEREWTEGGCDFLRELGLKAAAVTAPLKTLAYAVCSDFLSQPPLTIAALNELRAINTLYWHEQRALWIGTNTDVAGFQELVSAESLGETAIWGGGGTLNVISLVLPRAQAFSVRTGENRNAKGTSAESFRPQTVIWAGGSQTKREPPTDWQPTLVVDLSYSENSPARSYALARGARYVSGLKMFKSQAEGQRTFWSEIEGKKG